MRIIEITPLENGGHRNQDSSCLPPDGWALIPDNMETPNFPFGTIETAEVDGVQTVTSWTAGELPPVPVVPNSEKRKQAYETGEVDGVDYRVTWNDESYTTDALTQLGVRYQFRGEAETATEIETIVQAGVLAIRTAFPDEEENE